MSDLFIMQLMKGNEKFSKMVLKVTEDPKKLIELSKLCSYCYEKGLTDGVDRLLP